MSIDLEPHRPLARLLIRVLGLYFIVEGAGGFIGGSLDVVWRVRAMMAEGYSYSPGTPLAWTIGSVFLLAAGIYFVFKGNAALDLVFHESLSKPAVPCPKCGFDLRGRTKCTKCPECGTPLA